MYMAQPGSAHLRMLQGTSNGIESRRIEQHMLKDVFHDPTSSVSEREENLKVALLRLMISWLGIS